MLEFVQHIVAVAIVILGVFFLMAGSIGLIRLPDFYTRMHATGKTDMLGLLLVLVGLAIYEGFTVNAAKLLVAVAFLAFSSPVGSHALAKAAFMAGLRPWPESQKSKKTKGKS